MIDECDAIKVSTTKIILTIRVLSHILVKACEPWQCGSAVAYLVASQDDGRGFESRTFCRLRRHRYDLNRPLTAAVPITVVHMILIGIYPC